MTASHGDGSKKNAIFLVQAKARDRNRRIRVEDGADLLEPASTPRGRGPNPVAGRPGRAAARGRRQPRLPRTPSIHVPVRACASRFSARESPIRPLKSNPSAPHVVPDVQERSGLDAAGAAKPPVGLSIIGIVGRPEPYFN